MPSLVSLHPLRLVVLAAASLPVLRLVAIEPAPLVPLPVPPTTVTIDRPEPVAPALTMDAFTVSSNRARATEVEGPDPLDRYSPDYVLASGAETVDEFLGTLPRALGGGEQLVLVDGKPTYLDLSTLPVEMIEGIEVSRQGSMPEHGAFASGRVINIRLKKSYHGSKLKFNERGSFAGGGQRHSVSYSGGAVKDKWRAIYSLQFTRNEGLSALDRPFSRNQDHTALGGRDLRLLWGTPAVVESLDGTLDALTSLSGSPVAIALSPEGAGAGALPPNVFLPGQPLDASGVILAAGQRRFDTSPFLYLIAPSTQQGANLNLTYQLPARMEIALSGSVSLSRTHGTGAPPVTPLSASARVPAAYSPFGEDVAVGLVHTEFGPVRRESETRTTQLGLNLNGQAGERWRWNAGLGLNRNASAQDVTDLDTAAFYAALADPDPARRFNPFADPRVSAVNAHLYDGLRFERSSRNRAETARADFKAHGPVADLPAGPVQLSLGGNYTDAERERTLTRSRLEAPESIEDRSHSHALFANVTVPVIAAAEGRGGRPRVEAQLSGRWSEQSTGGGRENQQVGLTWVPTRSVLLRGTREEGIRKSATRILSENESLIGITVVDPRRSPAATSDVQVVTRDQVEPGRERSVRQTFGVTLEPEFTPGVRLSADHTERTRSNLLQSRFDPQDIVNNESAFPGRVLRREPTAIDEHLGQPGEIVSIDTTPGNAGESITRDLDLGLEYRLPWEQHGRFQVSASATWVLESRYAVQPGVAWVAEGKEGFTPPEWSGQGQVRWSNGEWTASTRVHYSAAVENEALPGFNVPSSTTLDLRAGFQVRRPFLGHLGKDFRVSAGVSNVFDEELPFADTLSGYRGGSPLGRGYELSFSLDL